jgi:hypothetical protein
MDSKRKNEGENDKGSDRTYEKLECLAEVNADLAVWR